MVKLKNTAKTTNVIHTSLYKIRQTFETKSCIYSDKSTILGHSLEHNQSTILERKMAYQKLPSFGDVIR